MRATLGHMSLTPQQRDATMRELQTNMQRSGLTAHQVAERLGLTPDDVTRVLAMDDVDPRHAWMVRDALETAVREAGNEPVAHSSLTEANRTKAAAWFGVGDYR